jgi:hypothetical protein
MVCTSSWVAGFASLIAGNFGNLNMKLCDMRLCDWLFIVGLCMIGLNALVLVGMLILFCWTELMQLIKVVLVIGILCWMVGKFIIPALKGLCAK